MIASLALGPASSRAQTIEGVLLERGTDRPIELGIVALLTLDGDSVATTLTDSEGRFRVVSDEAGQFRLAAAGLGYRTTVASSVFTLETGGSMSLEFRIEALAMELGGLTVEAQRSLIRQPRLIQNGFVDRVEQGFGRFVTPAQIERSSAFTTAELLQRTGRVTTRYTTGGERIVMLGRMGYCVPTVYLDGARIDISQLPIDAIAPKQILEGIEVYRSASEAPLMYGGGMGGCGVIVLWSRSR